MIYKSKFPNSEYQYHYVRFRKKTREFLIGEKINEVARSYQITCQRVIYDSLYDCWRDDIDYDEFCMADDLFEELYDLHIGAIDNEQVQ